MKNTKNDGKTISAAHPAIYNRLAVLRAERGLSRQQLAEALGINYQTVGYLERSEYYPSLELAFRISEFFALPIEAIFSTRPFKPMSDELYSHSTNAPRKDEQRGHGEIMRYTA